MAFANSSKGDVRLTGAGGRRIWPWIRAFTLGFCGFLIVFPGGIALGLAFRLAPDSTPADLFIVLGLIANLVLGVLLWLMGRRAHARSIWFPAFAIILVGVLLQSGVIR